MRVPPDQSSTRAANRSSVLRTLPGVIHGVRRVSRVLNAKASLPRATFFKDSMNASRKRE